MNIVADLGGTRIKIGLIKDGSILKSTLIDAIPGKSIENCLDLISRSAKQLLLELAISKKDIGGIGLSFPGIVDSKKKLVISDYVKYKNAQNFDFNHWAKEKWGVPLALENDAKAALLGEWKHGAGINYENVVLLTFGTGIGSAVLMNGQLLNGANFMAGNLGGHMTINLHGPLCNCGSLGCLEAEASTWSLPSILKQNSQFETSLLSKMDILDFKSLFEAAELKDPLALEVKENCLKAWGLSVVNMIHAFDPDIIIFGGGVMQNYLKIIPYIEKIVQKHAWKPASNHVKLVKASQFDYAALFGLNYLLEKNT
ncbi:ROK family protein [Pararhodonellum marinum]|uniref:ROK family protein n=1 Tax=Pararhodonellum marinum TaxID=2755358 RepID=UPI00188EE494|nr:ROK family protein [Pararhodonellum marinum]